MRNLLWKTDTLNVWDQRKIQIIKSTLNIPLRFPAVSQYLFFCFISPNYFSLTPTSKKHALIQVSSSKRNSVSKGPAQVNIFHNTILNIQPLIESKLWPRLHIHQGVHDKIYHLALGKLPERKFILSSNNHRSNSSIKLLAERNLGGSLRLTLGIGRQWLISGEIFKNGAFKCSLW